MAKETEDRDGWLCMDYFAIAVHEKPMKMLWIFSLDAFLLSRESVTICDMLSAKVDKINEWVESKSATQKKNNYNDPKPWEK